ncbi:ATP-binding sensor histidine kinase [Tychonema sp. LEGE 07203]|uniref:trifunctional serine/threonine-protein kinase/ATP-binding protein/sensor histidine kinase n=1 Tax=Tychonema sp. LEGE 07203 TaxID=1828671 RepID=UPI00187DDC25|nr:ATP-binding sensor histidine kinase [Tychonema sp. LEGE 07203]MBE9092629.1 AAA family ATPase [Tychonema sp. LEGE 07203]
MIELTGYQILDRIYSGTRTLVYRGTRLWDKKPVIIKILRNEYPSFSELVQFRNQYAIAKNLNLPGIIQTYSLEAYQNSYALIVEDFGGISLKEWTREGETVPSLVEFLLIAIDLCNILARLCRDRIIHKDIKPDNILINPETKQVKIIDFSIASLLPRETQTLMNPNVLEGTLSYISPEQTGRMNRGIDYRTDFYSLGVTFYELLTGKLPFQSTDPMELIHCHIAKQPLSVGEINPEIPLVLSSIVSKLMAKNAENRYQNALGLKADLEKCLQQLNQTGQIEDFVIGKRDLCDRFIIPEKLYGRASEVAALLAAFDRIAGKEQANNEKSRSEIMLVAGFSGIGKTVAVNEIHKPIVRQRGYFIKGKYDQFNRNIPFSAFVQAFRDLMAQLLSESDTQLTAWKTQILAALGANGQIIIEVIPELEQIIGKQPAAAELSGTAAQNRFNLLFQKFLQVFTTKEHPVVIFLDDLQWVDSASLNLMQLLMSESESGYLLLIGAYRDNEVSALHPLMLTIKEIRKSQATINIMTLTALTETSLNQLVADTLSCSSEIAQPLSQLVYQKTKGNPFFSTQFLKALHEDKLIEFNLNQGYWQCDIAAVQALALTDDVVEFLAQQLQKLPVMTQNMLKFAACMGNQFDLETLATVSEQSQVEAATNLWKALQEGLILPASKVYKFFQNPDADSTAKINFMVEVIDGQICAYRFLHDRVQQAAYSLIGEDQKQATHLKIGQLMLSHASAAEQQEKIFDIVNQLNMGAALVATQDERNHLARLNLTAATKAKASTAYEAALKYLNQAMSLLADTSWISEYELTLFIYTEAVEVEYFNTNFTNVEILSDIVFEQARTLLDKIKIYELKVLLYNAQNQMVKGVELGLEIARLLGISLCSLPKTTDGWTKLPSLEEVDALPVMTDPNLLAAMRLFTVVTPAAFVTSFTTYAQTILTMVNLCINSGHSALAAIAYSHYGLILCGMGDMDAGYHSGELALKLQDKFEANEFKCKVYMLFNGFIRLWKDHAKVCIVPLLESLQTGLDTGDIEFAGYSTFLYCDKAFGTGVFLEDVEQKQRSHIELMTKFKQDFTIYHDKVWHQLILNFQGLAAKCDRLIGDSFDETEMLAYLKATNNGMSLFTAYVAKTMLSYHFHESACAIENAVLAIEYAGGGTGTLAAAVHNFYYSLALLSVYPEAQPNEREQYLETVAANQQLMQHWANYAPCNYLHKWYLVEAERYRVLGKKADAIEMYDRTIQLAFTNEYIQEEALANELAAKFYLDWGKEKVAQSYMIDAYYAYSRWGAKAKVQDLETRYGQLLTPILQQPATQLTASESISSFLKTLISVHHTVSTSSYSTTISQMLDIATVLKAAQSLYGAIEMDELLSSLMQLVMKNAGADKALLILNKDGNLEIAAQCFIDSDCNLQTFSLDNCQELPVNVIYYVKGTQETLISTADSRIFASDSYLVKHQTQSFLCTPILNQGKLIGILYLENSVTAGAFTADRIELLKLLCSQAAISLENARLYQKSQQALENLQQAQLQLIQSEKMSALGNLVAGVAHEINNPIGFIAGNINEANAGVRDLIDYLRLYQEKFPQPGAELIEKAEEIDLDYLVEDLPKMLTSMKIGCDRIKNISTSLRTFSRADTAHKVQANIHEGLDSTLMILRHRLKAHEKHPEIKIIKQYGNLPKVQCYLGELNQVFMNLLANAIDALEESNQGRDFTDIQAHPNQISIRTEVEGEEVKIAIADNGNGISEEIKNSVFNHLFTTKEVGKGTGLGLAIARQIVVEKHGGSIHVNSQVGEGTEFIITLPIKT